jgi:hypothetical protein
MVRNNSTFSANNVSMDEGLGVDTTAIKKDKTTNEKLLDLRNAR